MTPRYFADGISELSIRGGYSALRGLRLILRLRFAHCRENAQGGGGGLVFTLLILLASVPPCKDYRESAALPAIQAFLRLFER